MSTLKSTLVHLAVVSVLCVTVVALLAGESAAAVPGKGLLAAGGNWIGLVRRLTFDGVDAAIASAVGAPASGPTAGSGVAAKAAAVAHRCGDRYTKHLSRVPRLHCCLPPDVAGRRARSQQPPAASRHAIASYQPRIPKEHERGLP